MTGKHSNVTQIHQSDVVTRIRERHINQPGVYAFAHKASVPTPANDTETQAGETASRHDHRQILNDEREKLVRNCQIMKGALFNAGKRLERKNTAGQFTFALSGVYGFLVPLFTLQFEPFLTALVTYVVSFTSATAGAVSFAVAMLYHQKDLATRARNFYEAGRKINKLGKEVRIAPELTTAELHEHMNRYDDILAACENHDEIDYDYARLGLRPSETDKTRLQRWRRSRRRLDIRFGLQAYSLIAAVWLIPPVIGMAIWFSLNK